MSYNVLINKVDFPMVITNGQKFIRLPTSFDKKCRRLFAPNAPDDKNTSNVTVMNEIRRLRHEAFVLLVEKSLGRKLKPYEYPKSRKILPHTLLCKGTIASITMPLMEEVQGITFDVIADSKGPLFVELSTEVLEYLSQIVDKQLAIIVDHSPHKKHKARKGDRAIVGLQGASEYDKYGKTFIRCRRKDENGAKYKVLPYTGESEYDEALAEARKFLTNEVEESCDGLEESKDFEESCDAPDEDCMSE